MSNLKSTAGMRLRVSVACATALLLGWISCDQNNGKQNGMQHDTVAAPSPSKAVVNNAPESVELPYPKSPIPAEGRWVVPAQTYSDPQFNTPERYRIEFNRYWSIEVDFLYADVCADPLACRMPGWNDYDVLQVLHGCDKFDEWSAIAVNEHSASFSKEIPTSIIVSEKHGAGMVRYVPIFVWNGESKIATLLVKHLQNPQKQSGSFDKDKVTMLRNVLTCIRPAREGLAREQTEKAKKEQQEKEKKQRDQKEIDRAFK